MFVAIGIVVLLAMVFGGFMLAGGAMGPVLAALDAPAAEKAKIFGGNAQRLFGI